MTGPLSGAIEGYNRDDWVAKMEAADPTVSVDLLVRSLLSLGATPRDIARAIT